MGFMARGSLAGSSGASTTRFKRRKTTGDGGPRQGRVKKQVDNMKKKMGELCILSGTDGFFLFDSPALGLQTHWPDDRESCLALVRKFRDCQECGNQKANHEGVSILLKHKVCGEVGLYGLGLRDLEKVIGRIDSDLGGVKNAIELLQKLSNPHPESSIEPKETESCILDFEEIINSSSSPSAVTANVVFADCHGWDFDAGLQNTAVLKKGCLRESAREFMDVGFQEDEDLVQYFQVDVQNEGETAVQTEMSYLNTSFCDDNIDMNYIEIGDLMGDFVEGIQDQAMAMAMGRQDQALIEPNWDFSEVDFLQIIDLDDKDADEKETSEKEIEDSLTDDIC